MIELLSLDTLVDDEWVPVGLYGGKSFQWSEARKIRIQKQLMALVDLILVSFYLFELF